MLESFLSGLEPAQPLRKADPLRVEDVGVKVGLFLQEAALAYFQDNFMDAYGGSWTTRTDWFFHRIAHATKT